MLTDSNCCALEEHYESQGTDPTTVALLLLP